MVVVSVMYPAGADATFDMTYYRDKHVPLVDARWKANGLRDVKILLGIGAPGGAQATYSVMALLSFDSAADFDRAVAAHGAEIIGDIANFTNVQPIIQVNDVMA